MPIIAAPLEAIAVLGMSNLTQCSSFKHFIPIKGLFLLGFPCITLHRQGKRVDPGHFVSIDVHTATLNAHYKHSLGRIVLLSDTRTFTGRRWVGSCCHRGR